MKQYKELVIETAGLKPLLRGWLHAAAAISALPLTAAMCWYNQADQPRMYSLLVFALSTISLYAVSAIYHIGSWRGFWLRLWRTFDHANIFVAIAAGYTPICFNLLRGWQREVIMNVIWLMATLGVALCIFNSRLPRWMRTSLYLGMGWVSLFVIPLICQVLPWQAVASLLIVGLLYSTGAFVYAMRWPDPFPRVFGFHELFHLLVVVSSLIYIGVIWFWILPFPRL